LFQVAIRYHCRVWRDWRDKNKKVTILNYTPSVPDENNNNPPSSPDKSSLSVALDVVPVPVSVAHRDVNVDVHSDEELGATGGVPLDSTVSGQTHVANCLNQNAIVEGTHRYVSYYVDLHEGGICDVCRQPLRMHNVVTVQHHKVESSQIEGVDHNNSCDFHPDQNKMAIPMMSYVSLPMLPTVMISSSYPCLQKRSNDIPGTETNNSHRCLSYPHGQQTLKKATQTEKVSPVKKPDQDWLPDPRHSSTPCKKYKKRACKDTDSVQMLLTYEDRPQASRPRQDRRPSTIQMDSGTMYRLLSNQSDMSFDDNSVPTHQKETKQSGSMERLLNISDHSGSCNTSVDGPKIQVQENTLREIHVKPHRETCIESEHNVGAKIDNLKETSV
jgi:hypothetical protein